VLKNGFAFKSSKYINDGIPVIRIGDINDWNVDESNAKCVAGNKEYDNYIVEKGDILIAMSGATTGKFGIYDSDNKAYQNQRVGNLKPHSKNLIDKKYIFNLLYSLKYQIEKEAYGGAQPNISAGKIHAMRTLLAPLPEQRAIVAKIEELFSDLDKGIADLNKAKDQLVIFRQAVLKKAFEGELTKEWREKQTNLPTADELLEQIKEERERFYNQQVEDWKTAVKEWAKIGKKGKKPGKPRLLKELEVFTDSDLAELHQLNSFWSWVKVDKLCQHNQNAIKAGPFGSSLKKAFYTEKGYKIYGQEQVISGDYKFGNYYVNAEKYQSLISCAVKPNDVLISLVGTVGKVLILHEDCEEGLINPRLVKLSLNDFYLEQFFKYFFESGFIKSIYKLKNHGTTMDVLNLGIIKELPFPLCSKKEQHQIVREIESRLSVCDKVEQSIVESLEKAKTLRQSILKKAFEGTLLSNEEIERCKQEEDYEPASVLLEKIKNEKKK
jgi:type I restriction enzyme S subunit